MRRIFNKCNWKIGNQYFHIKYDVNVNEQICHYSNVNEVEFVWKYYTNTENTCLIDKHWIYISIH